MASCKRSPASKEDDKEEEYVDEDGQSRQEFEQFKRWLDESVPRGSDQPAPVMQPPPVPAGPCQACGWPKCR